MVACKFTVLLEPAGKGGFVVKCLELPVASEGETKEEALSKSKKPSKAIRKSNQNCSR